MCGIFVHNFLSDIEQPLFHRGPDNYGFKAIHDWKFHHNRLSIQDLSSASSQPFSLNNKSYLIYNGEIYNHSQIRRDYFKGTYFSTSGDTEVMYQILESGQYDLLDKIEGIFAFVFYDGQRLIYGRDPFGVKPLFRYRKGSFVALSSEINPLARLETLSINSEYLPELIKYKFIGHRNSIYKGVDKVLPGKIYIEENGNSKELLYTTVFKYFDDAMSISDSEIDNQLKSAIKLQLTADVKVGLQLSGGIDSTLIAKNIGSGIKTFSSVFASGYQWNEEYYIKQVLDKYNMHNIEIPFTSDYFEKNLSAVFFRRGGLSHPHTLAIEQISQEAARHVKVLISGEGADELFLGYDRYLKVNSDDDIIQNGEFFTCEELKSLFNWTNDNTYLANKSRSQFLTTVSGSLKTKLQLVEINFHLSNLLERQDLATMKFSIEGRVPFLAQSFARNVFRIPMSKLVNTTGKLPLKRIACAEFGDEFAYRKKIGFRIPVNEWMYSDFCYKLILSQISTSDLVNFWIKKEILEDIKERRGIFHDAFKYGKLFWTILNLSKL